MNSLVRICEFDSLDSKKASSLAKLNFEENNFFEFEGEAKKLFCEKTSESAYLEKKKDQFFLKAEIDNNFVGMIGIHVICSKIHVRSFFVDISYQKRGIGRKLLEKCESNVKKRFPKERKLWVKSVKGSVGAYSKFGFEKIGKLERTKLGFLHQLMVKNIL